MNRTVWDRGNRKASSQNRTALQEEFRKEGGISGAGREQGGQSRQYPVDLPGARLIVQEAPAGVQRDHGQNGRGGSLAGPRPTSLLRQPRRSRSEEHDHSVMRSHTSHVGADILANKLTWYTGYQTIFDIHEHIIIIINILFKILTK